MVEDNHEQRSGEIIGYSGFFRHTIWSVSPVEHVYRGFLLTDSSNRSGATIATLCEMMGKTKESVKIQQLIFGSKEVKGFYEY